jgi:hypothetical protein
MKYGRLRAAALLSASPQQQKLPSLPVILGLYSTAPRRERRRSAEKGFEGFNRGAPERQRENPA